MKICGRNDEHQLCETSNKKVTRGIQCISPPLNSNLNIPIILSFSIYSLHSVWIENDGRGFAVGYNGDGSILNTLPKETFKEEKEIIIKDENDNTCMLLSAVCGSNYTLYLISGQSGSNNRLVYNSSKSPLSPLFLKVNGPNPIRLFGGHLTSAAIDREGGVLLITHKVFSTPETPLKRFTFPDNQKAISVACLNDVAFVLTDAGNVYKIDSKDKCFKDKTDLVLSKISDISGTAEHCFAVSNNGTAFCYGSNDSGQLGTGRKPLKTSSFIKITTLSKHKITAAYAGYSHSLFQTDKGEILACGSNACGELLLESEPGEEKSYAPFKTSVKGDALFCIAGESVSVVFDEYDPPPKTPNMQVMNNL